MLIDFFRWWLVVAMLGLLALPLSVWLFRGLPERGYSFAKALGLLLTGYGAWLLSMLGLGSFGAVQLSIIAVVIGLSGALLLRREWQRFGAAALRQQVPWIIFQEALFAAALYGGIWLRWHQFWGFGAGIQVTEQPMDLTLLSGILNSPQFPPQDPWFAPYPINYYYLGYLLIAALVRLAGVSVGVGYTLGLATIFALTAIGVAGVIRNLIDLTDHGASGPSKPAVGVVAGEPAALPSTATGEPSQAWWPRFGRWIFPLLGVVLVLICANQAGALAVLAGSEKVVALEPTQLARAVANGLGPRDTIDLPPPFPAGEFDGTAQLDPAFPVSSQSLAWWSSRAVWDDLRRADGRVDRVYNITEFPFFSFLLGDLHPHVQSLPWTLLAVALALNVLTGKRAPDFHSWAGVVRLIVTGIVLGGLYAINSWDLPTYLLLYLGALALLYFRLAGTARRFFWAHFIQQAGATILVSYLVYIPFHLTFVAPTVGFPLGISPARTGLVEFLIIFGLFFVPLLGFVVARVARDLLPQTRSLVAQALLLGACGALLLLGSMISWPLLGLLPLALAAIYAAYGYREQPSAAFALWVFALGSLVVWGVDVVFLRDIYGTRMNTIFKFYYQVWLLWGTLAAYAMWLLSRNLSWRTLLWLAPVLLLLVGSFVYPLRAPADQAAQRTLDGLAFLERERPAEQAAVDWIRTHTAPNAVVLQAPGKPYRADTARIASVTGRPTVIGWTQHEELWRGGQPELRDQVRTRAEDVTTLYTTTDPAQAQSLLARYNVDFVVVGPNEQALVAEANAPASALTKFDDWMELAFQAGDYTIYRQP